MPNQVNLVFAGDADKLAKESKRAEASVAGVGDAALDSSKAMAKAGSEAADTTDRMAKLAQITDGTSTAISDAAGTLQALADVSDAARAADVKLKRALNDVDQAQQDYNQALQDGRQGQLDATQAGIDYEQAQVDARVALDDYNAAVKEFGAGSAEAAQALVDQKQAQADANQARADGEQALLTGTQATIDATGATLDLSDAQREANPPDIQKWADQINMYAPLLSGLVGIMGLVAAAQWVWNLAQLASPTTWIIAGIVALIAIIVAIATQTEWFTDIWEASWGWIKTTAEDVWNWIKQVPGWIGDAFVSVGDAIALPFKTAFNGIANMWNSTVGSLSWTVPDWIPGIGGSTISVPRIPTFHDGGMVGGAPGSEVLALLQAGERVIPAGRAGGGAGSTTLTFAGNTSDALATVIMELYRTGRIQVTTGV